MPINGANRLVSKFSRLYAKAAPEEQFALDISSLNRVESSHWRRTR